MRKALVVVESSELGNIHWSILRGLVKNGLPVYPLVLPRTGPATMDDNSQAVAVWSSRDDVGMVLTVGPNDHLLPTAFDAARHFGKPVVSIQIDDDWGIRGGFVLYVDLYDEVLTSAESCISLYLEKGVRRCEFLPFAIDEDVFYPNDSVPKDIGVLFVGSATPHRSRAVAQLRVQGIDVHWAGPGGGRRIPAWSIPHLVWQSCICLNFSDQPDGTPGMKIRPFEYAACGTCVVSERWSGDTDLFTDHETVFVNSPYELEQKIRWLFEDGLRPGAFMRESLKRVHPYHTWQFRLKHHVGRWKELLT